MCVLKDRVIVHMQVKCAWKLVLENVTVTHPFKKIGNQGEETQKKRRKDLI